MPLRSRFGNILTRRLMQVLIGARLQDTQTGCAAFPPACSRRLLRVEARGYEFELEMLIAARQLGVPLVEVPIRTIYEPGNKSSHFNPLTDSMKIYFVLLRFSSVSLMTALLDNLVFYLVWKRTGLVLESQVVARAGGGGLQLLDGAQARSSPRAKGTRCCCPSTCCWWSPAARRRTWASSFLTARFGVSAMPAKIFVETLLFFVNFAIQRMFIFREARPAHAGVRASAAFRG